MAKPPFQTDILDETDMLFASLKLGERERMYVVPHHATTPAYAMRNMHWRGKLMFKAAMKRHYAALDRFYHEALAKKACFYGPFKGEFGHFLLHNLPFLSHLHMQGVAIHYCGMEMHGPFLRDEAGHDMVHQWYPLRDFFAEAKPSANETLPPADVQGAIEAFRQKAFQSKLPFLDIDQAELYWWAFRNWQLEGKQHRYDISKLYAPSGKTNSVVIFPRSKGAATTPNNGGPWNYAGLAQALTPYFDQVKLVGHPSLSADVAAAGKVQWCVSSSNADTLLHCAQAQLIITPHSGAVHLGAYVDAPVLLIFNGQPPIKGLIDTLRFRANLDQKPLNYAFNLPEIVNFAAALQRR